MARNIPKSRFSLNNLALLLNHASRASDAEPLYRRALAIDEKSYGPNHPSVALVVTNLAGLLADEGRWNDAAALYARTTSILLGADSARTVGNGDFQKALVSKNTGEFRAHARALFKASATDPKNLTQGFELAQWALQSAAADALSSMSVRFAKSDANLAKLVRNQQDLAAGREISLSKP